MKLKLLFYSALILLIASEVYRTYLLMPMPGSQLEPAVDISYTLYSYRWIIRIVLLLFIAIGSRSAFEKRKWIPVLSLLIGGIIFYLATVKMTAESMFHEPESLRYAKADDTELPDDALVISIVNGDEARAYPIRYLTFHHQVPDSIGQQAVMVTYCSVCRSGIVFAPDSTTGDGKFRLVGMDQFNAMFEDSETGSWWMQATGVCVAGELKGNHLEVYPSEQLSFGEWKKRYPDGKVMLPDPAYADRYDDDKFEKGTTTSSLEYTDTAAWQDKSWIVGIEHNGSYRAYDWQQLIRERVIQDNLGGDQIILTIDDENVNFFAHVYTQEKPDSIVGGDSIMKFGYHPGFSMLPIPARQMFWHSWKVFYPATTRYGIK